MSSIFYFQLNHLSSVKFSKDPSNCTTGRSAPGQITFLLSRQTHACGIVANLPITSRPMSRHSGEVGARRPVNGHLSPTHSLDSSLRPVNEFHIGMRNGDLSGPTKLSTRFVGEMSRIIRNFKSYGMLLRLN